MTTTDTTEGAAALGHTVATMQASVARFARNYLNAARRARYAQLVLDEQQEAAYRQRQAADVGSFTFDPDEALVWAHGTDAVALAAPDEARVLVRASILLDSGVSPADVVRALAAWGARYPELVNTAPAAPYDPWRAELVLTRPPSCPDRVQSPYSTTSWLRCIRAAGHHGPCDAGPF
jgi:hypothetical protein